MIRGAGATRAGGAVTGGAGASCGAGGVSAGPAGVSATVFGSCSWLMTRVVNTPTVAMDSASPTSRNFSGRVP
jgi:hypothetical protein